MKKTVIYPWTPAPFTKAELVSMQNLVKGEATEGQQKRALEWILRSVCELNGLSFRPEEGGGARATDFAEGKRWVALQICKLINTNMDDIKE